MLSNPCAGAAFDDPDVARAYMHRPPYPEELYRFLAELPPKRERALDLGCGPGKLAHRLAECFAHVDAVDPSLPMLRLADDGRHPNITWIHGFAETADLTGPYDLITAGASIHWMDHAALFPRMSAALAEGGVLTVIEGDDARVPPWQDAWEDFLRRWLARLGRAYDPTGFHDTMTAYRAWMDVAGERIFEALHAQRVKDFVECQHSRATWSRTALGPLSAEFDADLHDVLRPYAESGMLRYTTRTEVVWGRPI